MNQNGMRIKRSLRQQLIEVVLPTRPRPYVRGDGPALAPLHIALKNDSPAYIAWKAVWPDLSRAGRDREQLFYVVRWPDSPAASLAVPANEILDYVSPRALEDYEYACSLERDDLEQEFIRRERKAKADRAERAATKGTEMALTVSLQAIKAGADTTVTSTPIMSAGSVRKKRGRPSKADLLLRQSSNNEIRTMPLSATSIEISIPSLSTPQKPLDVVSGDESDNLVNQLQHKSAPRSTNTSRVGWSPSLGVSGTYMDGNSVRNNDDDPALSSVGFTPAARSTGKWPSSPRSEVPVVVSSAPEIAETSAKSTRKRKRNVSERASPPEEFRYVVECLEDEQYVDLNDGKPPVRLFLVRWEGDWPPDQNPTWEPEIYLPKKLVKSYLKRKADKIKEARLERPSQPRRVPALPKYSSVAEAFEGDITDVPRQPMQLDHEADEDDGAEETLLVEERERTSEPPERHLQSHDDLSFGGVRPILGFNSNGNGY